VGDEPLWVAARDHDRADAVVGLCASDERLEVGGDLGSELTPRSTLQLGDQNASSLLDVDPEALVFCGRHVRPFVEQAVADWQLSTLS
jgi:hypothetical protein